MKVEVRNLKKHFGRTKAVDEVSFAFDPGHIVGFVGPNGAGKTTTMRVLATLDEPTEGDAFIDGISVSNYPDKVRHLVGFVPDALPAQNDITIHEYFDFFARAYKLNGRARRAAVQAVEEFTGLTSLREKLLNTLSKGMKQRVCLGRALIHDPPVLILDEPAAGLDPRARVELRELLFILAKQNKAILISSHILTELTEICNAVVIIESGRILESGSITEVQGRTRTRRTVAVRIIGSHDALHKELLEMPGVESVKQVSEHVLVEVGGSDETCCELLAELLRRKHRVVDFHQRNAGLEDIFMTITKGELQ